MPLTYLVLIILALLPLEVLGQGYYFDESVPFAIEDVQEAVYEQTFIQPGVDIKVSFLPVERFVERFGDVGAFYTGFNEIYFNQWYYPKGWKRTFTCMLIHELGHAVGLRFDGQIHSEDRNSIMYPTVKCKQVGTEDRLKFWLAANIN